MSQGITVAWLRGRWQGKDAWRSDGAGRGNGQLVARRRRDGALFYYRYALAEKRPDGRTKEASVALGAFDEAGKNGGITLAQAREKAGDLAKRYRDLDKNEGSRDLRGALESEAAAKERARIAAEEAEQRAIEAAQSSTLRQLLEAYVAHMQHQGKQSWRDAQSLFTKHVLKADPDLAARKASDITVDDFVKVIGRPVAAKKGRTAGKLRSALRAAYSTAIRARHDPRSQAFRVFGVTSNPVADVASMSEFNRVRDRHLSAPELGALLRRLDLLRPGAQRDVLQLLLLLGGQRPMQLLRLKAADVDLAADLIVLHDTKGARKTPRIHALPLVTEAHEILARRIGTLQVGEPLFSTDGASAMRVETIGGVMADIAAQMLKEKECRELFQLRDLRRTCETMLASLGVSSDIRAQLQSHGLGGIQQRHYDRHSYALEKKGALEKWARHCARLKAGEEATVSSLAKKKRGR